MAKRIVLSILLATLIAACGFEASHPKDIELMARFNEDRVKFDELIQMFKEDRSLGRVDKDFERSASFFEKCDGEGAWNSSRILVDRTRIDDYRKRLAELKIAAGIEGYCEKDHIILIASTQGLSVTGSSKGYAFLKDPPAILVEDLDNYWSADRRSFTAYRHIDGNWYLYFDYED